MQNCKEHIWKEKKETCLPRFGVNLSVFVWKDEVYM